MSSRSLTLLDGAAAYELRIVGPDGTGTIHLTGQRRKEDSPGTPIRDFSARAFIRDGEVELVTDRGLLRCSVARQGRGIWVSCRGRSTYLELGSGTQRRAPAAVSRDEVRAPMTGILLEVRTEPGTRVVRGQTLSVMEAMKMEYRLPAPRDGEVEHVAFGPGDRVEVGAVLVRLKTDVAGG